MSGFYKMDPAAWDFGTSSLSLEEEAAYLRIVNAINKHDGPVPYLDRVFAGMFRCSTRKARSLVEALIAAGKVYVEDGAIWNERARGEVKKRSEESAKKAVAGAKGGSSRHNSQPFRDHFVTISTPEHSANPQPTDHEHDDKSLKTNDTVQAGASPRIEENRIDKEREPKGSPKKASRLPADWRLPRAWGEWALAEKLPEPDVRLEADKFRDYWHGESGQKAVKLDWLAVWRNWVRKAIADRRRAYRPMPSSTGEFGAFGRIREVS